MKDLVWQIPVGIFAAILIMRLILSPYWLFRERARQATDQENRLRSDIEQAQRLQPKLAGKINCLALEVHHQPSQPEGLYADCWFTMNVNVWNDGRAGTNITGFGFLVRWANSDTDWPTRQVEGLDRFRTRNLRPSDPGSDDRYTEDIEQLFDFPVPSEVTPTNSQNGWLRFVARDFPLKAGMELDFDTVIKLIAFDKKGEPHTVYEEKIPARDCPPIEAVPARSESQLQVNFHEQRAGYIDHTSVSMRGQPVPCTLYRVSVTYHGAKSTLADLKAEEVTLSDGRTYPPLYLRITGRPDSDKQVRLNPGTPVFGM